MVGAIEETSKHVGSFMDAMKREPLSLALVVMNLCLLLFCYLILTAIAAQREREVGLMYDDKKDVRELLAKCVVPSQQRSDSGVPLLGDDLMRVMHGVAK